MSLARFALLVPALLLAVSCSSAAPEAHGEHDIDHDGGHEEHEGEHAEGEHAEGEHHEAMDADLHAFHEVLAPVFHMEKGVARAEKACSDVPSMKDAAGKVASSRTEDDAKAKAAALVAAVDALGAACSNDTHGSEGRLDEVHAAFHAVMEAH